MRFYYGEKNTFRVLDEIEFWKRQEAEHTVVIREMVANLEERFVKELEDVHKKASKTEGLSVRYMETIIRSKGNIDTVIYQQIMQLIKISLYQSKEFISLLEEILNESEGISNNPIAVTVINHIIRESQYFIGIAQTIL